MIALLFERSECNNAITMLSQCYHNAITMLSQCHPNAITMLSQCYHNAITMLSGGCERNNARESAI